MASIAPRCVSTYAITACTRPAARAMKPIPRTLRRRWGNGTTDRRWMHWVFGGCASCGMSWIGRLLGTRLHDVRTTATLRLGRSRRSAWRS